MGKHRAAREPAHVSVPAQRTAPVLESRDGESRDEEFRDGESSVVDLINRSLATRSREVDLNSLLHATTHDSVLEAELDRIHDARQAHEARRRL